MRYELYYGRPSRAAASSSASHWRRRARTMSTWRAGRAGAACRDEEVARRRAHRAPTLCVAFLKAGKLIIGQTANILYYLGGASVWRAR